MHVARRATRSINIRTVTVGTVLELSLYITIATAELPQLGLFNFPFCSCSVPILIHVPAPVSLLAPFRSFTRRVAEFMKVPL